jgi:hypothetical protein
LLINNNIIVFKVRLIYLAFYFKEIGIEKILKIIYNIYIEQKIEEWFYEEYFWDI